MNEEIINPVHIAATELNRTKLNYNENCELLILVHFTRVDVNGP